MSNNDLMIHGLEFARAISNHKYEIAPNGIYFPEQRALVAGQFDTWINGKDHQVDPNLLPTAGLALVLKSGINGTSWYVSPFVNNVTPAAALTAATYTATQGEFILYDEAARVAWTIPTDPVAGSYTNSASPAVFTTGAGVGGGGQIIYGAAVLSIATKSATTGTLLAASKFAAARTLYATDLLTVQYSVNATST